VGLPHVEGDDEVPAMYRLARIRHAAMAGLIDIRTCKRDQCLPGFVNNRDILYHEEYASVLQ
jgi:hypothetical protein